MLLQGNLNLIPKMISKICASKGLKNLCEFMLSKSTCGAMLSSNSNVLPSSRHTTVGPKDIYEAFVESEFLDVFLLCKSCK